jgi:two-component sensor histidine kinase
MLLRGLHHQTKNNLALVAALLAQERRTATAEHDTRAAERLAKRVTAVALVQDRLSSVEGKGNGDGTGTDLAGYLHALLGSLDRSLRRRVVFEVNLESCTPPFDKTVAAGLVVDELATNAAKHAYPEGEVSVMRVELRTDEVGAEATLTVSDEGRGVDSTTITTRRAGEGRGA